MLVLVPEKTGNDLATPVTASSSAGEDWEQKGTPKVATRPEEEHGFDSSTILHTYYRTYESLNLAKR